MELTQQITELNQRLRDQVEEMKEYKQLLELRDQKAESHSGIVGKLQKKMIQSEENNKTLSEMVNRLQDQLQKATSAAEQHKMRQENKHKSSEELKNEEIQAAHAKTGLALFLQSIQVEEVLRQLHDLLWNVIALDGADKHHLRGIVNDPRTYYLVPLCGVC
jgi:SMC interacting uncharacterized protein involved in chromosome segregation